MQLITAKSVMLFVGLSVLGGILFFGGRSGVAVVQRTASGFVPEKLYVQKGDTIKFVNYLAQPTWPASDSHPTHGLYPEFDPTAAVAPGDSWEFTPLRAGVWNYHDHLQPQFTGTIVVLGDAGETRKSCLETAASTTNVCYEDELILTLQRDGLGAAFDLIKTWYRDEPSFQPKCHDVLHLLGPAAYERYEKDHTTITRAETMYCGYGFYHGFMEAMIFAKGPGNYDEVRAYCAAMRRGPRLDNFSASCYHGVGHAIFDSLSGALWGDDARMAAAGVASCEQVFGDEEEELQCASGVYNALDIAYQTRSYNLAFDVQDPLKVCAAQEKKYQPNCYIFIGVGALRYLELDREESLRFIRSIPDAESRVETLFGYVTDEVRRAIADIDLVAFASLCESFIQGDERDACVRGVVASLRESGRPEEEYKKMFAFCGVLTDSTLRLTCHSTTVRDARPLTQDAAGFLGACLAIPDEVLQRQCPQP